MATYVALLRGINVGGRNKIAMADLRELVEGLGHTDVKTYVNSGNVIFDADGRATAKEGDRLAGVIEKAIKSELGVSPAVLVRTAAELATVADANPYVDESDPKKVHVVFLSVPPTPAERKAAKDTERAAAEKGSRDELTIIKRAVYLHTPDGFGRSVLAELLSRRKAASTAKGTARNWSTVTKLLAMCQER
jgi:uncharacterized protein (DUF1697 family)